MQSPAFCGVSVLEASRRTRRKTGACLPCVVGSQWPAHPAEPSCWNGTRRAWCKTPGSAQGLHTHCPHQHCMRCSGAVRPFTSAAHHCHPSGKYACYVLGTASPCLPRGAQAQCPISNHSRTPTERFFSWHLSPLHAARG